MARRALLPSPWFVAALLAAATGCVDTQPPTVTSGQIPDDVPRYEGGFDDIEMGDAIDVPLAARGINPYPRYDLSYTLPYNGPEQTFLLEVQPRAGRLDVHFNVDTTGSFGGEIQALKANLNDVVIPRLRDRVVNLALGVSRFADFPLRPYGLVGDRPYDLLTPVTTDFSRVVHAVFSLDRPLQNGGDIPEAWIEALYQIGTGAGFNGGGATIDRFTPRPELEGSGTAGGVGFREGAARVVVNVTDAPSHEPYDYGMAVPGAHSLDQAAAALRMLGVRVIGIASGEAARAQLQAVAIATGAVVAPEAGRCLTGVRGTARAPVGDVCPLVFDIAGDGSGLADTTVDAITRFLDTLAFRTVTGGTESDPRGFVTAVEALSATVPPGVSGPQREDRVPAGMPDGLADTFTEVSTRTLLTFRVHVRNTRVQHEEYPQLFFVRVTLVGDGLVIAERVLRIIVPEGPKPDSAVDVSRDRAAVDTPTADGTFSDMTLTDASIDAPSDASIDAPPEAATEAAVPADAGGDRDDASVAPAGDAA